MKDLYLVAMSGELLHKGSKTDLEKYVRKNNIKRYNIKSRFVEKVMKFVEIETEREDSTPQPTLPVEIKTEADEKQSVFNKFFNG